MKNKKVSLLVRTFLVIIVLAVCSLIYVLNLPKKDSVETDSKMELYLQKVISESISEYMGEVPVIVTSDDNSILVEIQSDEKKELSDEQEEKIRNFVQKSVNEDKTVEITFAVQ